MYVTEATIREYDGQRFLSATVKKSNIIPIEDIGPLDETLTVHLGDTSKPVSNVKDVRVKGIEKFDTQSVSSRSARARSNRMKMMKRWVNVFVVALCRPFLLNRQLSLLPFVSNLRVGVSSNLEPLTMY